jgi:urease accessory protein
MKHSILQAAGRAGVLAAAWLLSADAHAHSAAKGIGDFYAGALHPLTSLEHLLAFLAFGILAGQQGQRAEPVLGAFCLSLLVGGALSVWLPDAPWLSLPNVASSIVFGGLVALSRPLPQPLFHAAAVLFGLSHGFTNGEGMADGGKPYLFIPGVALAGLVVTAYGLITTDWLLRRRAGWIRIAVRVAGSWIAAIGILVLAVATRALLTT